MTCYTCLSTCGITIQFQNVAFDLIIYFLDKYKNALQYEIFKENKFGFLKWLSAALDNGAKTAHSWVNKPNAVAPLDPFSSEDGWFASPIDAIDARATKWGSIWRRYEKKQT